MSTRPELRVVRDPGPWGPWLQEPAFGLHVIVAAFIAGLAGMLTGAVLTIVLLRTVGAL